MSVVTPVVFTPMHDEEVANLFSGNEESFRKMVRNLNYLGDFVPIGKILVFNNAQPGASLIDPNTWQYCDGSEITNPLSPIRSQGANIRHVPNMTNRYIRSAANASDNGTGGQQSVNFSHDHGGFTGFDTPPGPIMYQEDDENSNFVRVAHNHSITEHSVGTLSWDCPAYFYVGAYLKIS